MEHKLVMKDATQRSIFRWIHIIFSIPILGYIYSPFEKLPDYAPPNSVCLHSCDVPFGTVDVERPCRSATFFEKIGATRCGREPLAASRPALARRHGTGRPLVCSARPLQGTPILCATPA